MVTCETADNRTGAWTELSGVLAEPELDRGSMYFPVSISGSSDRDGFSIDVDRLEDWGQQQGRVRLVANGLAFLIRAAG